MTIVVYLYTSAVLVYVYSDIFSIRVPCISYYFRKHGRNIAIQTDA